jgi:hypothetical protein
LLCRRLDARLTGLAQKRGFVYSRYAMTGVSSDDARADVGALLKFWRGRWLKMKSSSSMQEKNAGDEAAKPPERDRVWSSTPKRRRAARFTRRFAAFRAFLHQFETLGREAMTEN